MVGQIGIEQVNPREFFDMLRLAVVDRGSGSLDTVSKFARSRDTEIKMPAMAALAGWGASGLLRVNEIALEQLSSKAVSAALKVHASVAAFGSLSIPGLFFWMEQDSFNFVDEVVRDQNLRAIARERLHDLIAELPTDELLIPLGTAFMQLAIGGEDCVSEIVAALSTKWLHFGPGALSAYQDLIQQHPTEEPLFQAFFERYPQILEPMAVQVWSRPDFHGALEPDFVMRRADGTYLIVEIECPSKTLMTRAGQLSAAATHAERQATEYREFIMERLAEARNHFPGIRDPDCLTVIGLHSGLNAKQLAALGSVNSMRHKLQTIGFDWLGQRAASILANLSNGEVEVVTGHRVI